MFHVTIPVTRCQCGQIIGDVVTHYQNLTNGGLSHREAIEALGITKICCLVSIQSFTTYPLKRARYGTSSVPSAPRENEFKKVYRTEGRNFRLDGPLSSLSEVVTSSFTSSSSSASEKRFTSKLIRSTPLSESEIARENVNKPPLEGIQSMDPNIDIFALEKGTVIPIDYVRDENGEPVMVKVGMNYEVPILQVCFVVAD